MLTELSTALSVAKQLREIQSRIQDPELKGLVADLQMALADLRSKLDELEEENERLRSQTTDAGAMADVRKNVDFEGGVYYLRTPMEGRPKGPYCPACLDSRDRLQVLRKLPADMMDFGKFQCPICNQTFGAAE